MWKIRPSWVAIPLALILELCLKTALAVPLPSVEVAGVWAPEVEANGAAAGEPQKREGEERTQSNTAPAPGSDPTVFIPGTSLDSFGQWEYFRLGKLLFRPSARINYTYETNLVNAPDRSLPEHSVWVEPAIEALIPISRNGIRLDYMASYKDYSRFELEHKLSHTVNADSLIDISPVMTLAVRDHFALTSLDAREFIPGREIIFSSAQFRRNDVDGQLNWMVGERDSIGLTAGWNAVVFDKQSTTGIPFYDFDQYRFGAFFKHEISPRAGLFVDGRHLRNATEDPRGIANSRGLEGVAGVEAAITPLTSAQFSAGLRRDVFPGAGSQNYQGAIFRGTVQKEFTETIRVGLSFSRTTNLSNFQRNAYCLTHGVGLSYTQELGPKMFFTIIPGYQRNSYPLLLQAGAGVPADLVGAAHRKDRIIDLQAVARYQFTDWVALDFLFDTTHRHSNLDGIGFRNYRAGMSLIIGPRGMARGRLFY